ncbi:hypothetical protein [Amycolatopsis sp. NPDC004378]
MGSEHRNPRSPRRPHVILLVGWLIVALAIGLLPLALHSAGSGPAVSGAPQVGAPATESPTGETPPPATVYAPQPTAPGSSPPADPQPLQEFVEECRLSAEHWRIAQIDYPQKLDLEKSVPGVYLAAVDVRDHPLPPEQVIPGLDLMGSSLDVKCVLSARLVGDDSMSVDPPAWTSRSFNPAGLLNWSWSVTGNTAGSRRLRLELQPAVVGAESASGATAGDGAAQTLTYLSVVEVSEPSLSATAAEPASPGPAASAGSGAAASGWDVGETGKKIIWLAGGLGVVVLAVLGWLAKVGRGVRGVRKAWRKPARKTGGKAETGRKGATGKSAKR